MSDLISRSALIEAMGKKYEVAEKKGLYAVGLDCGFIITEQIIKEQPTVEAKPVGEIHKLSESEFITFILSTICDYAKTNDYEITDTVKTMGENLVALTEICTFDNWKAGADMRGGKNERNTD